jgi:hypothetical protein
MDDYVGLVWGVICAIVLCTLIAVPAACTVRQTQAIAEMVEKGADPLKAACAIRGNGNEPWCVISANK